MRPRTVVAFAAGSYVAENSIGLFGAETASFGRFGVSLSRPMSIPAEVLPQIELRYTEISPFCVRQTPHSPLKAMTLSSMSAPLPYDLLRSPTLTKIPLAPLPSGFPFASTPMRLFVTDA